MQCFKIFQNRHFILFYFGTELNVLVGNVTAMQFIRMLVIAVVQVLQYIRPGNILKYKDLVLIGNSPKKVGFQKFYDIK